jgi:putative SOS response-associated peptidase YedK
MATLSALTKIQADIVRLMRDGWRIHPTWILKPPLGKKGETQLVSTQTFTSLRKKGCIVPVPGFAAGVRAYMLSASAVRK